MDVVYALKHLGHALYGFGGQHIACFHVVCQGFSDDTRRNKWWISDSNKDNSSPQFNTGVKNIDASSKEDKEISNEGNVAINMKAICNTEYIHSDLT